jgi:hypothetical protein
MSRRALVLGALACLAAAAGCGGGAATSQVRAEPTPSMWHDVDQVAVLAESLDDLEAALDEALAEGPDGVPVTVPVERCEEACNLCFNMCELSDRICEIAGRHRESGTLGAQCLDARVRCKRGTQDTDAVCDCSAVEVRIRI